MAFAPADDNRGELGVLLYLDWQIETDEAVIAPNIRIGRCANSQIEKLYRYLVLHDGVDDGDPLAYTTYVIFEPSSTDPYLLNFGDSSSLVERFSNALVIVSGSTLMWSRVIWSSDCFRSASGTSDLHYAGYETDQLGRAPSAAMTPASIALLKTIWGTIEKFWQEKKAARRISAALQYFYLAWRSHYLEQACLHLSVGMEILFAPHSHSETTHQLAFNIAHFHGLDSTDRERLYRVVKKFYGIRSSIIHGGAPEDALMREVTTEMFSLMVAILRRLLADADLAETVNSDSSRRALWDEYLFA